MALLTFRWVTVIAEYLQSETVADLLYVTWFCNVYAWILIKYQLHFDFLVVFTPPKALSTSLPCFVVIVLLKSALTSGRTLPGTTFFVLKFEATLQRRSWFGNFLHRCNSAVYRCQRAFPAAQNSHFLLLLQPALLQLFCSASWSHSAALQQRCSFRTG